jgi:hypothetical protein
VFRTHATEVAIEQGDNLLGVLNDALLGANG